MRRRVIVILNSSTSLPFDHSKYKGEGSREYRLFERFGRLKRNAEWKTASPPSSNA